MLFKKTTDVSAPRSLQEVPAFVQAEQRLQALQVHDSANRDEQHRIHQELRELQARRRPVASGVAAVAAALAEGASWEAAQAQPMANDSALEEQLGELHQREVVLKKALELAERRLLEVRREASATVYAEHRADHAHHVRTMAAALIAFCWARTAERAFRSALEDDGLLGIPATGGSYIFDEIGWPDGRNGGALWSYLQDLEACGFITSTEYEAVLKGEAFTP